MFVVCPDPKKCLPHLGICEQKKAIKYRCYLQESGKEHLVSNIALAGASCSSQKTQQWNDVPLHEQWSHSPYGQWCWFFKWCHQYLSRNFSHQVASYPKPSNLRSSAIIYVDPKLEHLSMFQMMFQLPDC